MRYPLNGLVLLSIAAGAAAGGEEKPAVKDKARPVRILLVAGGPTREYQFLRTTLARQMVREKAELTIYLQPLADKQPNPPGAIDQDVPREHLLAHFPDKLDLKSNEQAERRYDLASYDVIVAFDPDWKLLTADQCQLLERWVKRGGGLILVAGPINTFDLVRAGELRQRLKPIADLYPMVLDDIRLVEPNRSTGEPRRLTFPQGKATPAFLKLDGAKEDPAPGWEEFFSETKPGDKAPQGAPERGIFNYYPVREARPQAVVLATLDTPEAKLASGAHQPFLAVMPAGRGRVAYLSSGEIWRLRQYRESFYDQFWLGLIAHVVVPPEPAKKELKPDEQEPDLNQISMEIQALRALRDLRWTSEQLTALLKLSRDTAEPQRQRQAGKVSADYRKTLVGLRKAFLEEDDNAIEDLDEELNTLTDMEKPMLDDGVEVTAAARKRVAETIKLLKPAQVAGYLGGIAEELAEPQDVLIDGLTKVREAKDWEEERDNLADKVAWAAAGASPERFAEVRKQAIDLLARAHQLPAEDFKKQKAELETSARKLFADLTAVDVLRHTLEWHLADLLSNPRLQAVVKKKLKSGRL